MAARKARRKPAGNVGRSGQEVAWYKAPWTPRQIQAALVGDKSVGVPPFNVITGRAVHWWNGDRWFVQPHPSSNNGYSQIIWNGPPGYKAPADAGWENAVANSAGVVKAEKRTLENFTTIGGVRGVHTFDRVAGKQRPRINLGSGRPKKARGVATRGSDKGRGANRGAAK